MEAFLISYTQGKIENVDKMQVASLLGKYITNYLGTHGITGLPSKDYIEILDICQNAGLVKRWLDDLNGKRLGLMTLKNMYLVIGNYTLPEMRDIILKNSATGGPYTFNMNKGTLENARVRDVQVDKMTRANVTKAEETTGVEILHQIKDLDLTSEGYCSATAAGKFSIVWVRSKTHYWKYEDAKKVETFITNYCQKNNIGYQNIRIQGSNLGVSILKDRVVTKGLSSITIPRVITNIKEDGNIITIDFVNRPYSCSLNEKGQLEIKLKEKD